MILFYVEWTVTCFEKISKYFIASDGFLNNFKHIEENCNKMKYFEIFPKHVEHFFLLETYSTQAEGKKNSEKDASISNALVENFRGPI
jgi:hypothetical protein